MAKTKEQKEAIIKDLKENISRQKAAVFIDFGDLDSKTLFQLRDELKQSNCLLRVVKKTLLNKAFQALEEKNLAEKLEEIEERLALAFGFKDELIPAKICYKFSQENENLKILGGILGTKFLTKEKIIELAQIPSTEELLARLVGSISSPISNFVHVLKGNIKGLICVLNAIKQTK